MDYNQINIPKPKGLWRILFVVVLFLILVPFVSPKIEEKLEKVKEAGKQQLEESGFLIVNKIISGDMIELVTGEKIKYIGIIVPPIDNNECYALESINKNKEFLSGKRVKLFKDKNIVDNDENDFLLRYVYLPDETFVNLELVKEGYATIENNLTFEFYNDFSLAEEEAKAQKKGIWGNCK